MKTVIYTTFYPSIMKYFNDFIDSINSQTLKILNYLYVLMDAN